MSALREAQGQVYLLPGDIAGRLDMVSIKSGYCWLRFQPIQQVKGRVSPQGGFMSMEGAESNMLRMVQALPKVGAHTLRLADLPKHTLVN